MEAVNWILESGALPPPHCALAQAGGKAWSLLQLQAAGFRVPPFFVIRADALPCGPDGIPVMTPGLQEALQQALHRLCPSGETVAVRSSGIMEDGSRQSFAGQFESYLGISPGQVAETVQAVWRSAQSQRVGVYAEGAGQAVFPAVIVQRMVNADSAGVAFSSDPVSGQRMAVTVGAVYGLGSALVSGECDADSWRFSHTGKRLESQVALKKLAHRLDPASGQVVSLPVPEPYNAKPALEEAQAAEVAQLAVRAADYFQCPQDIEWAFEQGQLYLLQSRPLTTLHRLPDPDATLHYWDNSQLIDCYSGTTTPLTWSFARRFYLAYYLQLFRLFGDPRQPESQVRPHLEHALGFIRHRIYYNMSRLEPVYRHIPDARNLAWQGVKALPGQMAGLWRLWQPFRRREADIREFYANTRRLLQIGTSKRPNLNLLRADQLAQYYEDLEGLLRFEWQAVVANDHLANLFHEWLCRAVRRWCNDPAATLVNDLLCGETGIVSLEPGLRIQAMAETAARQPELVGVLAGGNLDAIRMALPHCPELAAQLQLYWDDFGDRCPEDLKLESAPVSENPLPLYRQIAMLAGQADRPGREDVQTLRLAAEARLRILAGKHPARRLILGWLLGHTRRIIKDRENMRFEMTRMMGRIRQIFLALGRKFKDEGWLGDPRDVFYLTVEEVLGTVYGTTASGDLAALVAQRRAEAGQAEHLTAPAMRFTTRGMVAAGNALDAVEGEEAGPAPEEHAPGESVKGQGCCPGVVRGRVRRVLDPANAHLEKGEILVAERSDPGWVVLFPAATGLLFEHGHALCHAAIVAREMGLPTVVALAGLTRWLNDGDWVEMDGRLGTVRKIAPPQA